jgi:hypothetical protein
LEDFEDTAAGEVKSRRSIVALAGIAVAKLLAEQVRDAGEPRRGSRPNDSPIGHAPADCSCGGSLTELQFGERPITARSESHRRQ